MCVSEREKQREIERRKERGRLVLKMNMNRVVFLEAFLSPECS